MADMDLPEDVRPHEDTITEPFWAATRQRNLVIQRCDACGEHQHYPRALCTHCGATAERLAFVEVSGAATLESFTEIARSIRPDIEAPYTVALVRLAEGPVLMSHLVDAPEPVCDMELQLDWRPIGDGRHLPIFRPA